MRRPTADSKLAAAFASAEHKARTLREGKMELVVYIRKGRCFDYETDVFPMTDDDVDRLMREKPGWGRR